MRFDQYEIPDDLVYHKEHHWLRKEGDHYILGITDFAQKLAGDITYVDTPSEGDRVALDKPFGTMESGKWVGKLYGPFDGEIVEVNGDIADDATLINKDPYGKGWIVKVKPKDPSQAAKLLTPAAYVEVMKQKLAEIKK
ncbi:MAG: glycine cleavage system protein GcvH [Thermoplasmatota archaeon]